MSELSPEAASLIASERDAHDPSSADRERMRAKLTRELGAAAFAVGVAGLAVQHGAQAASMAKAGTMSLAAKLGVAGLCAAVIGTAAAFTPRGEPTKPAPVAVAHSPKPAPAPVVEDVPEPTLESAPPAAEPAPVVRESAPPKPSPEARGMSLGKELVLLTSSQRALRENRYADALSIAKKHETNHPDGVLRVERMAVVALAHCGLGETSDPSVKALLEAAPSSPLAARVRSACGVE